MVKIKFKLKWKVNSEKSSSEMTIERKTIECLPEVFEITRERDKMMMVSQSVSGQTVVWRIYVHFTKSRKRVVCALCIRISRGNTNNPTAGAV